MMIFAIIENDVVVNTILADSLEIAQSLISENQEVEDVTGTLIGISWKRYEGILRPQKPDYDCVWHEETNMWLTDEEINTYNAIQERLKTETITEEITTDTAIDETIIT